MSVELPFAPVDSLLRRNADGLRIGSDATEELAERIQSRGATLATEAARAAEADGRKTLMTKDFDVDGDVPRKGDLELPIAPVDRIARLEIDDRYRVSMDARVALAAILEEFADDAAANAATLARHADRRTVKGEDVETYFAVRD